MNSTLIARCLKTLDTKFRVVGIMIFEMQCKNSFNNSVNKMSAGSISKFPTALLILLVSFLPFSFSGTITIFQYFVSCTYVCVSSKNMKKFVYKEIHMFLTNWEVKVTNKIRNVKNFERSRIKSNNHEDIKIVQSIPSMNSCQMTKLLKISNR